MSLDIKCDLGTLPRNQYYISYRDEKHTVGQEDTKDTRVRAFFVGMAVSSGVRRPISLAE